MPQSASIDVIYSELGKKSEYPHLYTKSVLFPLLRAPKRQEIGVEEGFLPFYGFDLWNHYEVSWLNEKGKPEVALAEIRYSAESLFIVESKSLKLYFNSLNQTQFKNSKALEMVIQKDLEEYLKTPVSIKLILLHQLKDEIVLAKLPGQLLDELDIDCSIYTVDPTLLKTEETIIEEVVTSNLLKSNCLVTHQPDWCSVQITYRGKKINHESLLQYIVSFRNSNEFHEQCIEKIFMHLLTYCQPEKLSVLGRSTRRGGLDINSFRSTERELANVTNVRLCRQ